MYDLNSVDVNPTESIVLKFLFNLECLQKSYSLLLRLQVALRTGSIFLLFLTYSLIRSLFDSLYILLA